MQVRWLTLGARSRLFQIAAASAQGHHITKVPDTGSSIRVGLICSSVCINVTAHSMHSNLNFDVNLLISSGVYFTFCFAKHSDAMNPCGMVRLWQRRRDNMRCVEDGVVPSFRRDSPSVTSSQATVCLQHVRWSFASSQALRRSFLLTWIPCMNSTTTCKS